MGIDRDAVLGVINGLAAQFRQFDTPWVIGTILEKHSASNRQYHTTTHGLTLDWSLQGCYRQLIMRNTPWRQLTGDHQMPV